MEMIKKMLINLIRRISRELNDINLQQITDKYYNYEKGQFPICNQKGSC